MDENTIGVAAVLGTTFTGHADDIRGINDLLVRLRDEKGLDVPLHVDGASGGFVWPFLYPDSAWDFRLEQVRSINVSGHKFGLVCPGIGWLVFRERSDLAEDLVFYENYLGKTDATFTLNFSTGSSMVLAQYYNFVRYGRDGYRYIMETMQANTRALAAAIEGIGEFRLVGDPDAERHIGERPARQSADALAVVGACPGAAGGWPVLAGIGGGCGCVVVFVLRRDADRLPAGRAGDLAAGLAVVAGQRVRAVRAGELNHRDHLRAKRNVGRGRPSAAVASGFGSA